ncbi:hypothetical protein GGS20DRAFT_6966 [Poronia punctata]|nr:hypothetical protein GGS20DRAFT_6966 [Poronia punctata]
MSADLFAAFEDLPKPQQQQQSPDPTNPKSTTVLFPTSSSTPLATNSKQQQWGQSSSSSPLEQYRPSWQSSQASSAFATKPASTLSHTLSNTDGPAKVSSGGPEDEDDDGWGDFEVAPVNVPSPAPIQPSPVAPSPAIAGQSIPRNTGLQRAGVVRAPTLELVSNNLVDFRGVTTRPSSTTGSPFPAVDPQPSPQFPKIQTEKRTTNSDPNVLFDADDFDGDQDAEQSDEEDDFGDFETVASPSNPISNTLPIHPSRSAETASALLLDLDLNDHSTTSTPALPTAPAHPDPATRVADSNKRKSIVKKAQPQSAKAPAARRTTSAKTFPRQESPQVKTEPTEPSWDWEPVEGPPPAQRKSLVKETPQPPPSASNPTDVVDASWDWEPIEANGEVAPETEDSALPPINIPPPSILMSVFPQLFDQANEHLYKPINGQPPAIKDRVLADPKVHEFLLGYLSLSVVAARIIAGRKLRWHRDKYLAQSMSISAAGSRGMKLAGVDKTQATREDREAADIVSAWKSQVGRLRSTVAAVNSAAKGSRKILRIPEISDTIQVQTAKGVPTAVKSCVICGLKRNERLAKIDLEVEDSFGEWWVDHWGHLACKRFWVQHEATLRQR